jgi:hypothetical protein
MACRQNLFRSWNYQLRCSRRSLCSSSSSSSSKNSSTQPSSQSKIPNSPQIHFSTPKISNYRKNLKSTTDFEIPLSLKNSSPSSIPSGTSGSDTEDISTIAVTENGDEKKNLSNIEFSVPIMKPNKSYHQHVNDSILNEEKSIPSSPSAAKDTSPDENPDPKDGGDGDDKGNENEKEDKEYKFGSSHFMSGMIGFFLGVVTSYVFVKNQWIDIDTGVVLLEEPNPSSSSLSDPSSSTPSWLQLPKK